MQFDYTPEQIQLRKTVREFAETEIGPHVLEASNVILDFAAVSFMDSAGIRAARRTPDAGLHERIAVHTKPK